MMFKKKDKSKRLKRWLLIVLLVVILVPLTWVLFTKLEGEKPRLTLNLSSKVVPADFEITGYADDQKNGIKKVLVSLVQNGKETVLMDNHYPLASFFQDGKMHHAPITLHINAQKMKLADGPAKLRLTVWDHSWRNWFKGNQTYAEKEIIFDTTSPVLSVLSTQHNVTVGGAGLVIYKLSEPCRQSGVYVGDQFFPGHSGYYDDKNIYLAFFAIPFDYAKQSEILVKAVDLAGNTARSGFYHHIRNKNFKSDTINISDSFLNWKLPEFQSVEGFPSDKSPQEQFVFVNSVLRQANNQMILSNSKKTDNQIFWHGVFGRLPNSARRANFADHRVYKYKGANISKADHLGIDLASVKHAEVPAANRGRVVFTGPAGIYGNLVCIDHGFGLISIYGHLSRIMVKENDMVDKGDIIGYTGTTGLAGGDHLHFGMFIDHTFVNPIEWWDASWIKNNITAKLDAVQKMIP